MKQDQPPMRASFPQSRPDWSSKRPVSRVQPRILVRALPGQRARGTVLAGTTQFPCALGPAGIRAAKREGDGVTPNGSFHLTQVMFRPDRIGRPRFALPVRALQQNFGWCDDVGSPLYNKPVCRPFTPSHEALWREDHLYDCLAVIDYNTARIRRGRGSAIFLHIAAPGFTPTAGCVAVRSSDLAKLLARIGRRTRLLIRSS